MRRISPYEISLGSKTISTDSAWPVLPVPTFSYSAVLLSPPEYPDRTFFTPLVYWYTPCTPQKQPPASTAVCVGPADLGLSSAGAGITTAASPERPGVFHRTPTAAARMSTPIHQLFFATLDIADSFILDTRLGRWTSPEPYGFRLRAASSRGESISMGTGNTIVDALSPAMFVRVCR